jgi:hypothetical protein
VAAAPSGPEIAPRDSFAQRRADGRRRLVKAASVTMKYSRNLSLAYETFDRYHGFMIKASEVVIVKHHDLVTN